MRLRQNKSLAEILAGLDWVTLLLYLGIVAFGLMCIFSSEHLASEEVTRLADSARTVKQLEWLGITLVLGIGLFFFNPRLFDDFSLPVYLFSLVLLVAVIFLGVDIKGSHSWFAFGPIRFQPAEFAKIATALLLSSMLAAHNFSLSRRDDLFKAIAVVMVPPMLVVLSKETGSALVFMSLFLVLYKEGLSGWWIGLVAAAIISFILELFSGPYVALGAMAALLAVIALAFRHYKHIWKIILALAVIGSLWIFSVDYIFNHVLQDHQRGRIEVLLGLREDPSGIGYNVSQSMIAIGSGGATGKGYLQGTQNTLGFIPEQSTDFIFCTVGEEFGFVGSALLILAYVLLVTRICYMGVRSKNKFTECYSFCLACYLGFHLFVNIGMTIGIMPVIGIPLPFFSYGGSSLLCFSLMIFIYLALVANERNR